MLFGIYDIAVKNFDEKNRARFGKIITLMRKGTHEGERQAARAAAIRLSEQCGLSLDQALDQYENDGIGRDAMQHERQDRRQSYQQWAYHYSMATHARQRAQKQAWEQAVHQAQERTNQARPNFEDDTPQSQAHPQQGKRLKSAYIPRYRPSHYQQTEEDRFRLVRGLLLDGASFKITAGLTGESMNEVVRIWLMVRHDLTKQSFKTTKRSVPSGVILKNRAQELAKS